MMFTRVGRALFIVGNQFRQKLTENSCNTASAMVCAASSTIHRTPNTYVFRRNYCDNRDVEAAEEAENDDIPKLITRDQEGTTALEEFLSSPENQRTYKIIELELEMMRQNSEKVPAEMKPRHWAELVKMGSRTKRRRYCTFLWGLEMTKANEKEAKLRKRQEYEDSLVDGKAPKPHYSLGENSLFMRFYDQTMNKMWNNRLINQMMFGQNIVLDCGYESHMVVREIRNCAKQLQLSFAANRIHRDPFNMYLCNADRQGQLMTDLHRAIPTLYENWFPLNIERSSYLDIFDKKQLVYLTPHCSQEMYEFDYDAIYIIGAFVDKHSGDPISMAKAKREGLKMMKFPLDRYLQWGSSSGKNLTLNQVINVLLDLRFHGSWEKALQAVPRRKLIESRNYAIERKMRSRSLTTVDDDNDTQTTEDLTIKPVQEIRATLGRRYNADNDIHNPKRDNYRSSFQQGSKSSYRERYGSTVEQDFTMKSRAKLKNNWKN